MDGSLPVEAQMLQLVQGHSDMIQMLDVFHVEDECFMALEFPGLDWDTMFDQIYNHGSMDHEAVRDVFGKIIKAVKKLHDLGYCHNDIKGT